MKHLVILVLALAAACGKEETPAQKTMTPGSKVGTPALKVPETPAVPSTDTAKAALQKSIADTKALIEKKQADAKALLDKGAKADAADAKGQTALIWAAADGHADVVEARGPGRQAADRRAVIVLEVGGEIFGIVGDEVRGEPLGAVQRLAAGVELALRRGDVALRLGDGGGRTTCGSLRAERGGGEHGNHRQGKNGMREAHRGLRQRPRNASTTPSPRPAVACSEWNRKSGATRSAWLQG